MDPEIKEIRSPLTIQTADNHHFLLPPMYHSHTGSVLVQRNFDFIQSTMSTTVMYDSTGATLTWPCFSDHVPSDVNTKSSV